MNILISNDDGYLARGITALAQQMRELGNVTIVAPESNRSGASNAITLDKSVELKKHAADLYSVSGTPADCFQVAFGGLLDPLPDIVISGINNGPNMGDDTLYSGTVGAAREGRFRPHPPIAVSMATFAPTHFETAARVVSDIVKHFASADKQHLRAQFDGIEVRPVLNVNVPDVAYEDLRGVRITRLGSRHAPVPAAPEDDDANKHRYWLGPAGEIKDAAEGTDFHAVANGYVSVTPLKTDQTDHGLMGDLQGLLL